MIQTDHNSKDGVIILIIFYLQQIILQSQKMRFFLKIKQNGRQIGVRRIQAKSDLASTDQLLSLVKLAVKSDQSNFIVRVVQDQNRIRIIKGWSLEQCFIKTGQQLEVQLLSTAKQMSPTASVGDSQVGELLFSKQSMGKIIEENQQEEEKSTEISTLVIKKYEQLLKHIQKNNTSAYLQQMKAKHPTLGPCQNEFYKKQLIQIQNQLGARGWAAIHCAVFAGNVEIVNYLIQIGVDINTKTSDEWLPIQLAVRQQNYQIIDILVAQPFLNINICTAHGLVLNMAVQTLNMSIVNKLLMKDVNFTARDHLGRTVFDVLGPNPDKEMQELLHREERRQSITVMMAEKNVMYHALISSYRGEIVSIKTPPRKNKQYYICLNPYEKAFKIYAQKIHYPQFPKQIVQFGMISRFDQMNKSQKSWYMKNDLFYFIVATPKTRYTFGCHFQPTVFRWIEAYNQCKQHISTYPDSIKQFQRNQSVILDRVHQDGDEIKKKVSTNSKKDDLLNLFTSRCTQRTDQTKSKTPQNKKIKSNAEEQKDKPQIQSARTKSETMNNLSPERRKVSIDSQVINKNGLKYSDFRIIKALGEGSFGTVYLAIDLRNPEKKKHYALKCFKKKKLVINKQIKYTITELNILKQLCHPFIVNLHFTFQTPNYVYLGLDYCPNRDLSHHLMNEVTFPEKQALIYAAQILLALEYLHEKNIIYRDLKPENIMLDEQGHVRLVDFGLSKQGNDRDFVARSFCGSPAYLSPEMLVKKGVGKESDFYCLGAVLYEMIVGQPPFFSDDITTLYNNISTSKLTFPKSVSQQARTLLTGLLQRVPSKRLGFKGAQQIKDQAFFKDINWTALLKKSIKAPVRQQVQLEQEDETVAVQILHQDFDYSPQNYRVNRFLNFSFVREDNNDAKE